MRIVAYVGRGLLVAGVAALSWWLWSLAWWVAVSWWAACVAVAVTAWEAMGPQFFGQHGRRGPRARQDGRRGPSGPTLPRSTPEA